MLTLLLLLNVAGNLAQAGDRHRDRRAFARDVEVFVSTPYGGGYFVKGYPYYGRYSDRDYRRYERRHLRKHYYKKAKRYRSGYLYFDDHRGGHRYRRHR
jgi:hypothetical protein